MFTFEFIVDSTSYSVPFPQCGTVLYTMKYSKVQSFYWKVQYSICLLLFFNRYFHPLIQAWAELYTLASVVGLGRALYFGLWHRFGPSFMPCSLIWAIHLWAYFIFRFLHLQLPLKSLLFIEERDLTETVEKYIALIWKVLNEVRSGIGWSAILLENRVRFADW